MENSARERYNRFFIRGEPIDGPVHLPGPLAAEAPTPFAVYDAGYRKWLDEGGSKN